jgi:N-methylhydantoinase A
MARLLPSPTRIAIDTGGTFTDCVWTEKGRIHTLKVFSTASDPSLAILQVLERIQPSLPLILLHGTTVGTNSLLQRKGGRVVLVTTSGFEDVIEIGRQARPKLYDFFFDKVEPLVPPELRCGVSERTSAEGEILQALSAAQLSALVEKVAAIRPQAIAISFLFSFANPQNESATAKSLQSLGLPLSVSHCILPEFREYERTSTVVVNAYLQPVMQQYLEQLESRARQWSTSQVDNPARSTGTSVFVMQSSGGITAVRSAAREPVRTVLSGPAGGVVGAVASARRSGVHRIISFDMGGTSTDVALVDHEPQPGTQREVAGLAVGVPMLDIHTVGAGGGSIARFDAAGALRVGPESAGADPGPICYGRGLQPTVTDANLLLGRLRSHRFLGGEFRLDLDRTRRVLKEWLKEHGSKLTVEQFALGVIRVVNSTMEKAIRVVSIERGYDSREFSLIAFGGAGGLHACELADALGIRQVIVPALPGALSAFGILVSDIVKDYSRTVLWRTGPQLPKGRLESEFAKLRGAAKQDFADEHWLGAIHFSTTVDIRYRGQGYELNLPFTSSVLKAFHSEHERRYGYSHPDREVELVTLRLRATVKSSAPKLTKQPSDANGKATLEQAKVLFEKHAVLTAIHDREQLQPLRKYMGPAIVTEYSATTVIPPRKRFWLDRSGNLIIQMKTDSKKQVR